MHIGSIDRHAKMALNHYHQEIRKQLPETDVISYYGNIDDLSPSMLDDIIRVTRNPTTLPNDNLAIILTTGGGSARAAEKMVDIMRHYYKHVSYIVPDHAMSAGTILCMSGDSIYMGYASSLGPIDPQVPDKTGAFVPALGYLDKVEEIIEKSKNNTCSQAEFMILANMDLGTLRVYEQARDLSITLLKDWLVNYKFRNWSHHSGGKVVTPEEKTARADDIAKHLCNHKYWHSHGRYISMKLLIEEPIRLKIENLDASPDLSFAVHAYHDLMQDYQRLTNINCILHNGVDIVSI